jgi:hypothetical protein
MLEELEKIFVPYISFHLRDLYLRFNLMKPDNEGQLKKENLDLFSHINSEFVHKYMEFLFCSGSGIAPHVLITYIQTLKNEQQKNAMTVIIEFFNMRSINTYEILIDHEFKNESLQVFVNDVN